MAMLLLSWFVLSVPVSPVLGRVIARKFAE